MEAVRDTINDGMGEVTQKAREVDVSRRTMLRLVQEDLQLSSYKRTPKQALVELSDLCGIPETGVSRAREKNRTEWWWLQQRGARCPTAGATQKSCKHP